MRLRTSIGVAAAIAMAAAGCTTPGGSTSGATQGGGGGTLIYAIADEPDALDPTLANTFVARVVFTTFCEKLYDTNDTLELVPQLASGPPEASKDGLTVEIPLREGLKFNDGTPFDAQAVKTTLDRNLTLEGSSRKRELAAVKSVEVVDPTRVRIKLSRPFSPLGAQLADRAGTIMSPAQLEKLGKDFGREPVCVGPFKFAGRTSGSEIRFTKSDQYYDKDKVKLQGVTYRFISEPNTRAANLQSGDIHGAERLEATDVPRLKGDANVKISDISSIGYQGISINVGNVAGVDKPAGKIDTPLGRDPELRKAFEMSLDTKAMNTVVYDGQQAVDCLPLPEQSKFRPADPACTPFDPEQAKKIVDASGEKKPVPVELMIPSNSGVDRLAQVIQSMAAKAGFEVKIHPQEFVSALAAARGGKFDAFLIGWSGRIDPDGNLADLVTTGGSNNFSGNSDKKLDDLVAKAAEVNDPAERTEIYTQALAQVKELRSNIYLYHERWFLGLSSKVTGVVYPPDGIPRFKTASLTP
jgi:peptide/nickel transport system substrate-binding protein